MLETMKLEVGVPLPAEFLAMASAAGLVRVNGLPRWGFGNYERQPMLVPDPELREFGHYCTNQGSLFVAVTRTGDIFWGESKTSPVVSEARGRFLDRNELFSGPGWAWVPCADHHKFLVDHIMDRLADPYCEPARGYTTHF